MKKEIFASAFARHREVLEKSESVLPDVARAGEVLLAAVKAGKKVLACGNGGSAADAEHFVGEFLCRYKGDRKPLPAISLVSAAGALTAIGNDYAYEEVFARQINALGNEGDVLVAITTSGKSKNILAALRAAKEKKLRSILLTGPGGASLTNDADVVVAVPSDEMARVQEMHELIYHSWCEFLDAELSG
ncbi:MAG: SIS domain-containing protein [Candidatus Liptonbacteria bacterium]|nr:SIS domain-containing protein [Candidatus Liptonbacteria bacterium]